MPDVPVLDINALEGLATGVFVRDAGDGQIYLVGAAGAALLAGAGPIADAISALATTIVGARDQVLDIQEILGESYGPIADQVSTLNEITRVADANDPTNDVDIAHRYRDDKGAIIAKLHKDGTYIGRGFAAVDHDGGAGVYGAKDGTPYMERANIAGELTQEARFDDPIWQRRVIDKYGAIFQGVPKNAAYITDRELAARMAMVNAAKPRWRSRHKATLGVIIDDLNPTDEWVIDLADRLNLKLGFALNTANVNADTVRLYQLAYTRGHSILSHSTDATAMSSAPANQAAIDAVEAKMANSKAVLRSYGFETPGFVTPNSVLHAAYFAALRKHYDYAFTFTDIGSWPEPTQKVQGWDRAIDPTELGRKGIENLLNINSGTYGGHNVAAVTDDMDAAAASGFFRMYYNHGVPSSYYTNVDTTPRPSAAEFTTILEHLADLKRSGAAEVLPPDQAIAFYYSTLFS